MSIFKEIFKNKEAKNVGSASVPFGSEECGKFLKETYANSINETTILDDSFYEKISEYDEINKSIKTLESKKKVIEHELQSELKEYEIGFCKERKITWKPVTKSNIDTKMLKADMPEVVASYSKVSVSRVFRIK